MGATDTSLINCLEDLKKNQAKQRR
jgi:hypothetical protein